MIGRLLRSRVALWVAFLAVHAWITYIGTVLIPTRAFWDLDLYRWWMWQGLHQGIWPVLSGDWVYPAGALLPMLAPALVDSAGTRTYALAWCVLITALNAVAVVVLLRAARWTGPFLRVRGVAPGGTVRADAARGNTARGRAAAQDATPEHDPAIGAWWWVAFVLLLGPVAIGRLDAVVAPVVVIALALALRHPAVASALLTFGAWVKVAPGALLLPLVLVLRRPWRDLVAPAAAVCVVVVGAVAAWGGLAHLTSFLTEQGSRGLQLESVAATPWLLAGLGSDSVTIGLNEEITTWEIAGTGTAAIAGALGLVLPIVLAAGTALLLWVRHRAGEDLDVAGFLARGALLVAVLLIVTNKVGSPQFVGWLAGPVVVGLARPGAGGVRSWRTTALLVLVIAALTHYVFPLSYEAITGGVPGPTLVLALRNVLLVALAVLATRDLLRLAGPRRHPGRAPEREAAARA